MQAFGQNASDGKVRCIMKAYTCDVLICGSGVAGLYCALNLPQDKKITVIAKTSFTDCDSYLAQGGICVLRDENDYDSYFEDTMKAGHYINNPQSVDIMIRSSQDVIKDLISYGTRFEKNEDGSLKYTKEGAHSNKRILFHQDITGKEITSHLLDRVRERKNITLLDNTAMLDIITYKESIDCPRRVCGIIAKCSKKSPLAIYSEVKSGNDGYIVRMFAKDVVWACGGIGGLYSHSTNYPELTGDALAIALRHNIPLRDPDYIQIHPTTLYSLKGGRAFLISESVRGEGGILLDKNGNRFVNELLPRDVVSNAIYEQMAKDNTDFVYLSMENISESEIKSHFAHIYEHCLSEGYDCTKEPIPVVPAQHYFMGGVDVDSDSQTSLMHLYACGETSCNGVHGRNRLASNSLLESLVFAKRAAKNIQSESLSDSIDLESVAENTHTDVALYSDTQKLYAQYKSEVLNEIKRMEQYHEQVNNGTERRQLDPAGFKGRYF